MTTDKARDINYAIAQVLDLGPFERFNNKGKKSEAGAHIRYKNCLGGGWYEWVSIPNFVGSRDACAMFEKKLTVREEIEYFRHLTFDLPQGLHFSCMKHCCFATPEQRCEAFIRTKEIIIK